MGRASSETLSLSGSECSSRGQQRMALLGSTVPFSLSVPHRLPQYCIHGTNGIRPYVQRPARAHIICDRHLCSACSGQQSSAAEHSCHCPRSPPSREICKRQKRSPCPPPTLQIFNHIAAVMVCICYGAFPQINLALK